LDVAYLPKTHEKRLGPQSAGIESAVDLLKMGLEFPDP
jgi:hypothetical protein